MSNLDTTTPMSEFNVVDENGNTTVVPLSANGGEKLYEHRLCNWGVPYYKIISNTNIAFTTTSFAEWLFNNGFKAINSMLECLYQGVTKSESTFTKIIGIWSTDGVNLTIQKQTIDPLNVTVSYVQQTDTTNYTDKIIEL